MRDRYMHHWAILRKCCGPQASKAHREVVHGLPPPRSPEALDNPRCELYDLDAVEEALFNTTLWRGHYAVHRGDFTREKGQEMRRGVCCHSDVDLRRGFDFKGRWAPTPHQKAYLAGHGDPRDATAPDARVACAHRHFRTPNAHFVGCAADRKGRPTC